MKEHKSNHLSGSSYLHRVFTADSGTGCVETLLVPRRLWRAPWQETQSAPERLLHQLSREMTREQITQELH